MPRESPCDRIRQARERLGLTPEQVANLMGVPAPWYYDVEAYPDEVFTTVSLAYLQLLGQIVGLEPIAIVAGNVTPANDRKQFQDVADGLRQQMQLEGLDAEAFGERVGWNISEVLIDAQKLWTFNVAGFRDVCTAAGVDWLAAFPNLP